ncbi:MAG: hypothetical protein U0264_12060 [Candidatus Kapaibacterium sp.]
MEIRTLLVLCMAALTMIQLQGCSTFCCGTAETRTLCDQIIHRPELLSEMTQNREIRCYLFGSPAHVSYMVGFIKQYFPPDSIESVGCEVFAADTRIQYQYYGTKRYNPIIQSVKKAYIRFIFTKEKGQWYLEAVYDTHRPPKGGPRHDSDYYGEKMEE